MAARVVSVVCCFVLFINVVSGCWPSNTCCNDIQRGFCFHRKGVFDIAPQCPSAYSPTFTLFTRQATSGVRISKDNIPSQFSNDRPTVFVVHGWRGSFRDRYVILKDELLARENLNVIAVDWRSGASAFVYFPAAANTQSIGALIGATVNSLRTRSGSNPNFWCIGHSLGAHACGYSSLTARPLLERITGVDPAGPSFGADKGLTRNSAAKVDVMHTDPVIGSIHPRGHVDFYPNGGKNQPGCPSNVAARANVIDPNSLSDEERIAIMQRADRERGEIINNIGCSHAVALTYMINSVKNNTCYVAKEVCTSHLNIPGSCTQIQSTSQYGIMGYDAIYNRYNGYLHLRTPQSSDQCAAS